LYDNTDTFFEENN